MNATQLKADFSAGFSVFLLALPLCLGIAMASNFPPISGVFTAIVGGIVCSFIGSSRLTIKGPAAGLIVIALGSVNELGQGDLVLGYQLTLAVGAIAAVLQILLAIGRQAVIAEIMPPAVIHGMLAAIGVIIISKQSHIMMGVAPHARGPLALLAEIPNSLTHANPEILAIGAVAFMTCVLWPKVKNLAAIPASIVVLVLVVPLSLVFDISHAHQYEFWGGVFEVGPKYLITLPSDVFAAITLPDFSQITSWTSIKYIIMFALVGSIESLLTVMAVDTLDPAKQRSDLNKDLLATGIGNLLASSIGGLPMISEIVRSKANIDYGAQSSKSNFIHGLLLLAAIVAIPGIIQLVPLAGLAALLVYTGMRLASLQEFRHVYAIGKDQFLIFMTTFCVTLLEDLLIGVAAGIIVKLVLHMKRGMSLRSLRSVDFDIVEEADTVTLRLRGPVIFTQYLQLQRTIDPLLASGRKLTIDCSGAQIIDHTVLARLLYLANETDDGLCQIAGLDSLEGLSAHPMAARLATQSTPRSPV